MTNRSFLSSVFSPFVKHFRIRQDERIPAFVAFIVATTLNALIICKYANVFLHYSKGPWGPFLSRFHVSGFDAFPYTLISHWSSFHHIGARHPLLIFILYPLSLINKLLYTITGLNCVQYVYAAVLIFCAVYAFIFLTRIFRFNIHTTRREALLLGAYTFSFAYMMITICVPDHFALSLFILTFILYLATPTTSTSHLSSDCGSSATSSSLSTNSPVSPHNLRIFKTFLLVFITAGITLTNGVKPMLAAIYQNRRKALRLKFIIVACILPIALNFVISHYQYKWIGRPAEVKREINAAKNDSIQQRLHPEKVKKKKRKNALERKKGKPIAETGMLQWSDLTSSRLDAAVHNLFGESIQLHKDSLLQDAGMRRPVIVKYHSPVPYIVEAIIFILFILGIYAGRRQAFLWLVMAWFACDLILHFGLGFGLIEVYIMTAHWAFVIPIATAYLFTSLKGKYRTILQITIAILTTYLWIYNTYLFTTYLYN